MTKEDIVFELQHEVHEVVFTKVNGDSRTMLCTQDLTAIPVDKWPKLAEDWKQDVESSSIRVYDIEANDWRSFRFDSVISFDGAPV